MTIDGTLKVSNNNLNAKEIRVIQIMRRWKLDGIYGTIAIEVQKGEPVRIETKESRVLQ